MSDSNVRFVGEGMDKSVFSHKNAATMNSSREGIVLTGSDVTFENLTIFNTYLQDGSGQQAEALYVKPTSQRVFLKCSLEKPTRHLEGRRSLRVHERWKDLRQYGPAVGLRSLLL